MPLTLFGSDDDVRPHPVFVAPDAERSRSVPTRCQFLVSVVSAYRRITAALTSAGLPETAASPCSRMRIQLLEI
jgi:hypothetical protein